MEILEAADVAPQEVLAQTVGFTNPVRCECTSSGCGNKVWRGSLFLFLIPLVLVQIVLQPVYSAEHHWADFVYTLVFFVSGYILYADQWRPTRLNHRE